MHFQQDFRRFVLILVSGTDDDTPSVKGCFWLGYAVLGSIAWVKMAVKIIKNKIRQGLLTSHSDRSNQH